MECLHSTMSPSPQNIILVTAVATVVILTIVYVMEVSSNISNSNLDR